MTCTHKVNGKVVRCPPACPYQTNPYRTPFLVRLLKAVFR